MRRAATAARAIKSTAFNKDAFSDEDLAHYRDAFKNSYSATAAINTIARWPAAGSCADRLTRTG
jgi:hypothetical protein